MNQVALSCLAVLALTAAAANGQQDVTLRGEIENVPGQPSSFVLDFTDVSLTSGNLQLGAFLGQKVELTGTWNGSSNAPSVSVSSVSPAVENFEIGEELRIGQSSYLGFVGTPGQTAFGFLSLGAGFLPTSTGEVVLIDPNQVVLTLTGSILGNGERELPFAIPAAPALVGVELFGQGGLVSNGVVEITNPYARTIGF